MRCLTTLRAAGIAALLATGGSGLALAADMLSPPPPPPPMAYAPALDAGGGFYLRGDLGAGLYDHSSIDSLPPLAGLRTIDSSVSGTVFVGVGAGYQWNSFLRSDATIEYRVPTKHRHVDSFPGGGNLISGRIGGVVGLANAYVDLGTWHRVTPFIGAGIGFSSLTMSGTRDVNIVSGAVTNGRDKTSTRLAWALHAGLGYDLTSNIKAEVAYRYLNIGNVDSGTVTCLPACSYTVRVKNLDSHDVKFGLRYLFADMAPAYSQGPLVRKY